MANAAKWINALKNNQPDVYRLARLVSFATRVDPALIRRMRTRFLPGLNAGIEGDLWFCPLVQYRTVEGIVFFPEAADLLREELADEPNRYEDAWQETAEIHQHLTPALRLEEEVGYLQRSRTPRAKPRIKTLIRRAVVALVDEERKGLVHWAMRALPRFHSSILQMKETKALAAGARVRVSGGLDLADPSLNEGRLPDWVGDVLPETLPKVELNLSLFPGILEIDGPKQPDSVTMKVPKTDPIVLEIAEEYAKFFIEEKSSLDPDFKSYRFKQGETQRIKVAPGDLRLRTLFGDTFDLRLQLPEGVEEKTDGPRLITITDPDDPLLQPLQGFFVGRKKILWELTVFLREKGPRQKNRLVWLQGVSGIGKTELVKAALRELLDSKERATVQYLSCKGLDETQILGIVKGIDPIQSASTVLWLDDFEFRELLNELLEEIHALKDIQIIVTTRLAAPGLSWPLQLEGLEDDEAIELVRRVWNKHQGDPTFLNTLDDWIGGSTPNVQDLPMHVRTNPLYLVTIASLGAVLDFEKVIVWMDALAAWGWDILVRFSSEPFEKQSNAFLERERFLSLTKRFLMVKPKDQELQEAVGSYLYSYLVPSEGDRRSALLLILSFVEKSLKDFLRRFVESEYDGSMARAQKELMLQKKDIRSVTFGQFKKVLARISSTSQSKALNKAISEEWLIRVGYCARWRNVVAHDAQDEKIAGEEEVDAVFESVRVANWIEKELIPNIKRRPPEKKKVKERPIKKKAGKKATKKKAVKTQTETKAAKKRVLKKRPKTGKKK